MTFQITVCMSDFFYQSTKGKLLTDEKNTDNFIGARLVSTISCNHISILSENRKSKGGNAPKGAPVLAHALHERGSLLLSVKIVIEVQLRLSTKKGCKFLSKITTQKYTKP